MPSHSSAETPFGPMSSWQKWLVVGIVCMASICVTCTSSIYTTTYPQMNAEFGSSQLISTLGLSSFVLGIATGPLLTSPLSEHYGRRPVYLASWSLFIVWTIPSAVARNIETLIVSRFFAASFGSTFLSTSGGTVRDLFPRNALQTPMSLVTLAPFAGPTLGPVLGGAINFHQHWRWTYYFILIWVGFILMSIILFVPETLQKAESHRELKLATVLRISIQRPFQLLFYEPMCFCLGLYSAILLGILYAFFGAFPLVFGNTYHMNLWQVGLVFLGIILGMCLATVALLIYSSVHLDSVKNEISDSIEPEQTLRPAIAGSIFVPLGLFLFSWTIFESIHWIVPLIGSLLFGFGMMLLFTGIFTFLVDAYPKYAASALAGNGFMRASFAASFPLFSTAMYEDLGYQWASTVLAVLTVVMMPLPLLFFKYGKVLRGKSRFATLNAGQSV